jgi:hypothetical protein
MHEDSEVERFEESTSASSTPFVVVFADRSCESTKGVWEGPTVFLPISAGKGAASYGDLGNEGSRDLFETIFAPERCWLLEELGSENAMSWKRLDNTCFVDLERFSEDLDERTPQFRVRFFGFGEGFKEIDERLHHEAHVGRHQCLEVV